MITIPVKHLHLYSTTPLQYDVIKAMQHEYLFHRHYFVIITEITIKLFIINLASCDTNRTIIVYFNNWTTTIAQQNERFISLLNIT